MSLNSLAVFGNSFFDGNVGIGTTNPQAKLDVAGKIKVGDDVEAPTAGAIRFTGTDFEGYDGTQWVSFTSGGGGDPAGETLADFGNAKMYLSDGATISGSCSSQGQEIRITGSARYLNNKIQTRAYGDKVGNYKCDSGWIDGYSAECSTLQIVERVSARINTNINGVSGNSNSLGSGCTMISQDDGHCIGQSYDISCSFPTVSW